LICIDETLDARSWNLKKLVSTCWESLDSLKMTSQHVETSHDSFLDSLDHPKVSIFVKILIETLDLDSLKSLSRHLKKLVLELWKWHLNMSRLVTTVFSTVLITLKPQFLSRSWSRHLKKLIITCQESLDALKMTSRQSWLP
jgi:hypothetical protein